MGVQLQLANELDSGYLRLAAASAMLRLARGHDPRIQSETYFSLALTLQVHSQSIHVHSFPVASIVDGSNSRGRDSTCRPKPSVSAVTR